MITQGKLLALAKAYNRVCSILPLGKHSEFVEFITNNPEVAIKFQNGEMGILQDNSGRWIIVDMTCGFWDSIFSLTKCA